MAFKVAESEKPGRDMILGRVSQPFAGLLI